MPVPAQTNQPIESYADFWPYYLREHSKPQTRAIHYAGTAVAIASLAALAITGNAWFAPGAVIGGYAFAWVGHFFIEKNRPATFRHPIYSLMGDWMMFSDICRGRISI